MIYKVNYYTLSIHHKASGDSLGNIKQYDDEFYTSVEIKDIPTKLQEVIDGIRGENKFKPIITNIEYIEGHL